MDKELKEMSERETHEYLMMLNQPKAVDSKVEDGSNVSTAPGSLPDNDEVQEWLDYFDNNAEEVFATIGEPNPAENQPAATNVASLAPDGGINPAGDQPSTSNARPISPPPNAASPLPQRPPSRKRRRQDNQPPQPLNPRAAPQQTLAQVLEPGRREIRRLLNECPGFRFPELPHSTKKFDQINHIPPP